MEQDISREEVRRRMRLELPPHVFERSPATVILIPLFNAIIGALVYFTLVHEPNVLLRLFIAVLIGHQFFLLGIVAHDVMHGSVLRNKTARFVISRFAFYPFLFSPHLWDVWHTKAHHGHTNTRRDPDASKTKSEVRESRLARLGVSLMPSSDNRALGLFFYLYWFTLLGQVNLWFPNSEWKFKDLGFNKRRAIIDVFLYILIWALFSHYIGLYNVVFLVVVPMMVGNAIFMLYATTEHVYLPHTDSNNPLNNTVSVRVPRLVDVLTLNFSHHTEHHLFPRVSFRKLPFIRTWLEKNLPSYYMRPSMISALKIVFSTPRVYETPFHLTPLRKSGNTQVSTVSLRSAIRDKDSTKIASVLRGSKRWSRVY